MKRPLAILLVLLAPGLALAQASPPHLLQKPTVNKTHIVFAFADDLWIVPRAGGDAQRLTSGPGVETDPIFAPDGKSVAFTGEYEGNVDVYVMPAAGGQPRRLTYHPGLDRAIGWTPDGKSVLFYSQRNSYSRFGRLFTVSLAGGPAEQLPLPMADQGAYSPDGSRLACYVPARVANLRRLETLSWRHHQRHLAGRAVRFQHRPHPARQLQRHLSDVDRRPRLVPVRSQRADHAVQLRRQGEQGPAGHRQRRTGFQGCLGRPRLHRPGAVRLDPPFRFRARKSTQSGHPR